MQRKKRRMKIGQKQKRRRKNRFLRKLSSEELKQKESQEKLVRTRFDTRKYDGDHYNERTLMEVEKKLFISFDSLIEKLRTRFPGEKICVLDEGAGFSTLKKELESKYKDLKVTTTDIRYSCQPDVNSNVLDLAKKIGRGKFQLVVSTFGGATHSGNPEKAFYNIASVLSPGGIGVIHISKELDVFALAKRLNCTIKGIRIFGVSKDEQIVSFTKNTRQKKRK